MISHNRQMVDLGNYPAEVVHQQAKPPTHNLPEAPPSYGYDIVPHTYTFRGMMGTHARVYRSQYDEALRHSRENARHMRNECGIMECLESRQRSTALLDWHLEPENENSQEQKTLVEELTKIINRMRGFLEYRRHLLEAIWLGRTANVHRWAKEKVGPYWRSIIKTWQPRHGDKLVFRYGDGDLDYEEGQVGIRLGGGPRLKNKWRGEWLDQYYPKIAPTDYGLAYFLDHWEMPLINVHKHLIEDGEYEDPRTAGRIHGVGVRSRIYWTWYQMTECMAWIMEYLERSAFGVEIWPYRSGNKESHDATRTAAEEKIGGGRSIILVPVTNSENPELYFPQHIEPGLGGVEQTFRMVQEFFGHRIKRYILGQILTSEAEATGLGSGVADAHQATYFDIVQYDSRKLAETLTYQLVRPLQIQNFPASEGIHIKFVIETETQAAEETLAAWKQAYEMGLEIKSSDVYDLIGAGVPTDKDDTLSMTENQQAMFGGGPAGPGGAPGNMPQIGIPKDADGDGVAGENRIKQSLKQASKNANQSAEQSAAEQKGNPTLGQELR